jgi:hypothetical protein
LIDQIKQFRFASEYVFDALFAWAIVACGLYLGCDDFDDRDSLTIGEVRSVGFGLVFD